jgi:hypothetical protein
MFVTRDNNLEAIDRLQNDFELVELALFSKLYKVWTIKITFCILYALELP